MIVHSIALVRATPKECAIEGKLIVTIDASSVVMNAPTAARTSTTHLLARSRSLSSTTGAREVDVVTSCVLGREGLLCARESCGSFPAGKLCCSISISLLLPDDTWYSTDCK